MEKSQNLSVLCSGYLYLWTGNEKLNHQSRHHKDIDYKKKIKYPIENIVKNMKKQYRNTHLRTTQAHVYKESCIEICISELQKN